MGQSFSVVDVYLFVVSNWARSANVDLATYPHILALRRRIGARRAGGDESRGSHTMMRLVVLCRHWIAITLVSLLTDTASMPVSGKPTDELSSMNAHATSSVCVLRASTRS
jgi:hypothetical protein